MIEVLEFIFSSWQTYLGTVFLMLIISKWNLVKVVNKDTGVLDRLAEIGRQKKEEEQQLNS